MDMTMQAITICIGLYICMYKYVRWNVLFVQNNKKISLIDFAGH